MALEEKLLVHVVGRGGVEPAVVATADGEHVLVQKGHLEFVDETSGA